MIKLEELDRIRCEITTIPLRRYNHAARALQLADDLIKERDNLISLIKETLLLNGYKEKEAMEIIFSRLNGGTREVLRRTLTPYPQ